MDDIMLLSVQFDFRFDIVMFPETWLQKEDNPMSIPGYVHYFLNRPDKRGGGVSVHVSNKLRCEVLDEFTDGTSEYEVLSLKTDYDLVISVVYRPPSATPSVVWTCLDRYLDLCHPIIIP